jgi:hypothetical protein
MQDVEGVASDNLANEFGGGGAHGQNLNDDFALDMEG